MKTYEYLMIGGGMTAAAATTGIREIDPHGSIGMFSEEPDAPYDRPPLSKALWKGKSEESIWRKLKNVDLHLGHGITGILPEEKRVLCDDGKTYHYGKLLLATGGRPRRLPFTDERVIYFRTVSDYRHLRALTETARRFAVIGGGFIGSEIAAALTINGKEVVMIFPGKSIGERIFPADLAGHVSEYYKQKGVTLLSNEEVTGSEVRDNRSVLKTSSGREVVADAIVAGMGIEPNTSLAESTGLKIANGIVVDSHLRTSQSDIYAAGDVASFPYLEGHRRVEHEDNANTMGQMAGRNMAGENESYDHLPSFYSDLFDLGYEAVGELDARSETFADWKRLFEEGVIYYLRQGRVRGVLLWNVWGQVDAARKLIAEPGPFQPADLRGRII